MPVLAVQIIISLIMIGLLIGHIFFPDLKVDSIALTLLVLAIAPWLAPLIKSFELPGGVKIEFQEWRAAIANAEAFGFITYDDIPDTKKYTFQTVAKTDPALALAGLRMEIEKRLRQLATEYGVPENERLSSRALLNKLADFKVLSFDETSAIWKIVALLDKAVHGAEVENSVAEDAINVGPTLLKTLDDKIAEK